MGGPCTVRPTHEQWSWYFIQAPLYSSFAVILRFFITFLLEPYTLGGWWFWGVKWCLESHNVTFNCSSVTQGFQHWCSDTKDEIWCPGLHFFPLTIKTQGGASSPQSIPGGPVSVPCCEWTGPLLKVPFSWQAEEDSGHLVWWISGGSLSLWGTHGQLDLHC